MILKPIMLGHSHRKTIVVPKDSIFCVAGLAAYEELDWPPQAYVSHNGLDVAVPNTRKGRSFELDACLAPEEPVTWAPRSWKLITYYLSCVKATGTRTPNLSKPPPPPS